MSTKQYLESIPRLKVYIEIWQSDLDYIWMLKREYNTPGIISAEREARKRIKCLSSDRNAIIDQIQNMDHDNYRQLLYKRYIEEKPLEQIADEMCYSFEYTRRLHGKAVEYFGKHCNTRE